MIDAALQLLEAEGADALTMRRLADELGIKAPSLYKHLADKSALESALVEEAFSMLGTGLFSALEQCEPGDEVDVVLRTYRRYGIEHPNLYRLTTSAGLERQLLPDGLEEWAGTPFYLAAGEPYRAQALWAFAHGMVILEIDDRFMDTSDLDRTWAEGAAAFRSGE